MKAAQRRKSGRNGFDLIEEATQLLRTAPPATLAAYYLGTIPFVLGLLYFWVDMSRNPFASQHQAEAGLGVTALFFWMKFCQAWFARRLRAQLAAEEIPRWNLRQCLRVFLNQVIVQPSGLFLIPLSFILMLPFAWTYAFYQNATALADPDTRELSKTIKPAWKQASVWPWQNHLVLGVLIAFGTFVFLDWTVVCLMTPELLKTFFGIESVFSQSPLSMLNTTFFTAMFGLTYLCVDPLLKAIYVLRCFYGQSLQSGEDLKAELKRFAAAPAAIVLAVLWFSSCGATVSRADDAPPAGAPVTQTEIAPVVKPGELDRTINEVIHERKYAWRMPREKTAATDAEDGMFSRFFAKVGRMVREALKSIVEWLFKLIQKLFRLKSPNGNLGTGSGWITSLQVFLFVLVAAAVCALVIFLLRVWRGRQLTASPITTEAIQPAPDLADENIAADQLPEDGWTKLARELLERGEFRLAMRAFYLASLAHLAERNLIHIARFKSNREYENELRRRAHAIPDLIPVFGENLSIFERIWYGLHEVNRERVLQFAANVDKIKAVA